MELQKAQQHSPWVLQDQQSLCTVDGLPDVGLSYGYYLSCSLLITLVTSDVWPNPLFLSRLVVLEPL